MGTMLRRVPGTASWHVFQDGTKAGDVYQGPDGTWYAKDNSDLVQPIPTGTRKDAARLLTGQGT